MKRKVFAIALCALFLGTIPVQGQDLDFRLVRIPGPSSQGEGQLASLLFDIDRDGIEDMVVTERIATPSVVWYKRSGNSWTKYTIDNQQWRMDSGGDHYDLDRDGDEDFVVGCGPSCSDIFWYENPYPNYSTSRPWQRHVIKQSGADEHHDQVFGDFDGDGRVEFVTWNQGARQLLLAEIPSNPKSGPWSFTTIYRASDDEYEGLTAADIDQDGKVDLVGAGRWWKHQGGTSYSEQIIDAQRKFSRVSVGQLVPGGRQEVVFSDAERAGVLRWYWWTGSSWSGQTLASVNAGHSLELGDVNGDGNLDILSGEKAIHPYRESKTRVFLGNGNGGFQEVRISTGREAHESRLGDLDGDGDLDIMAKPFTYGVPGIDVWLNQSGRRPRNPGPDPAPGPGNNQRPSVAITSPSSNASFDEGVSIAVRASASDADGEIREVAFYADGRLLARDNSNPFGFTWTDVEAGSYELEAQATDDGGARVLSEAINVVVTTAANRPPSVVITHPEDGATFQPGASGTVTVRASDEDGRIERVAFFVNDTFLGEDTQAPYSYTLAGGAPVGTYVLRAEAIDNSGVVARDRVEVFVGTSGRPSPPSQPVGRGLVGLWRFDEGGGGAARDASGNGNNAQFEGSPEWTSDGDGALRLDGVQDYAYVFDEASVLDVSTRLTIMGWFKHDSQDGDGATGIEKRDAYRLMVQKARGAASHWLFDFWDTEDNFLRIRTVEPVSNDEWHHIAATYDGSEMKIYVDGVLDGSSEMEATIRSSGGPLEIGRRDGTDYFGGWIGEVRVYNTALSASQIRDAASGNDVGTQAAMGALAASELEAVEGRDLPGGYALTGAYPNPFNPQTQFTLEVSQSQHVRVAVYDVLGRQVAVLHEGSLSSRQQHRFTFEGSGLSSGTYVLRAEGETFEASKTMVLLK